MTRPDLVIANGTLALPGEAARGDVLVAEGRILDIVDPGTGRGARVIDASERIVLPGGIDPHVHFLIAFMGQKSVYDFTSGTAAALRGGVTTVIDFALQRRGKRMLDGLAYRRRQADGNVCCDYGLHLIATEVTEESLAEVPAVVAAGAASFKVYTIYESEGLQVEDGPLHALMGALGRAGGRMVIHAENASLIGYLQARHLARGEVAPRFHAVSRPPLSETEAVSRVIRLAADAGCAVHIFHLNSGPGLDVVEAAQAAGQDVSAETCTHYLALTDDVYERPDAHLFVMSPPLRDRVNQERIWQGVASGSLAIVTSDDASYSAAAKELGRERFDTIANGVPGVEARLPILYTLGVAQGRMTLPRFTAAWAGDAARLFGLAPEKGAIAPGADADLVVIEPVTVRRMSAASHHGPIGYTCYDGMDLVGWPVLTLRRGTVAVEDGTVLARAGDGRFLQRRPSADRSRASETAP